MELSPQLQTSQARSKGQGIWMTLALCLFICIGTGCGDGKKVLPAFTGRTAEVVVVMDKGLWDGPAGDAVREQLYAPFPHLPQLEPGFSIIHQSPNDLSYNLRLHRNLIIADIEENARNTEVRAVRKESQWSNGQVVYTFHALEADSFISKWNELAPTVMESIRSSDRTRRMAYLKSMQNGTISHTLKEKMNLDLLLHSEYKLHQVSSDFAWMTRERIQYLSGVGHDVIQGVAVYTRPYTSDSLLVPEVLSSGRDSLMGTKVLSRYDQPMRIETLLPPEYMQVPFKGAYAIEGRGLWRMDRPIMGGPFVSLSVVDEKNGRIITVDGYVFAPKFDKRNYLLDVEAILYSLTF